MRQPYNSFYRLGQGTWILKLGVLTLLIPVFVLFVFPYALNVQDKDNAAFLTKAGDNPPTDTYEWSDICVPQRLEITGVGMGDRYHTINPQSLSIIDPGNINGLLAQVVGRRINDAPVPDSVTFFTDSQQVVIQNEPGNVSSQSYNFVADLQPASVVTATVQNTGSVDRQTPRGLILYTQRITETGWSSIGQITNNYIYAGGEYSVVLDFPPLTQANDLLVTAIVTDNDNDTRPLVLEATSGNVTLNTTELGPTDGDLLNIVNLTLPRVPEGTSQVNITLRSPSIDGDSLVLSGVNVSFQCLPPPRLEALIHVLPSPSTIPESTTKLLTVTVTPGVDPVNGAQIYGRINKNYLDLVSITPVGPLTEIINAPQPRENDDYYYFQFAAGLLGGTLTQPFPVLELELRGKKQTDETLIEFFHNITPTGVSGPDGDVLSLTQDGIVIVSSPPQLTGIVDMQGRPDKPYFSWAIPLTVTLEPSDRSLPARSFPVNTNQYGQFTLSLGDMVVPGQYDILVKGNHTLRNLAEDVDLVLSDNFYYFGTLLEGDVETVMTFNRVIQEDADKLIMHFNTCSYNPVGFFPNADLDENGCVQLADFGLLSGNFGKEGDIIVSADTVALPQSFGMNDSQALIAFDVEEQIVAVDEIVTLDLYVEPRGQYVNGAMLNLTFDPASIEILDVTLKGKLPLVLMPPSVDNARGEVSFAAGIIGQTITERFSVATISLRVKSLASSTAITPVNAFPATAVSGAQGNIPTEITGITLKTATEETIFLPVILR